MDPRLARLLDRQEIEDIVARYCRGIDRRDFDLVRSCYHPDATDDHGSFSGDVDAYLTWVDALTARYRFTMHLLSQITIDFSSADSTRDPGVDPDLAPASGIAAADVAAVESYGVSIHRSDDPKPYLNLATGFRYLDRFERRAGRWKIAARVAVGEWSLRLPSDGWWPLPESHLSGQRDGSDALYRLLASVGAESRGDAQPSNRRSAPPRTQPKKRDEPA